MPRPLARNVVVRAGDGAVDFAWQVFEVAWVVDEINLGAIDHQQRDLVVVKKKSRYAAETL